MSEKYEFIVIEKIGVVSGKKMFKVEGSSAPWSGTPTEAIRVHKVLKAGYEEMLREQEREEKRAKERAEREEKRKERMNVK